MYTKSCVICGKEFQTKVWNRSVCYADHHHPCPVCGKDVLCNDPKRQHCACSIKCGQQLGNVSRAKSNLANYGVSNVAQLSEIRAKISTKLSELNPKQPVRHKICEVCGNEFELRWPYTQHTCSPKCRGEYRKLSGIAKSVYQKSTITNISKYGLANPGQRPEIHRKMEDTMEKRYGVRYARYIPEIEERVRQTCLARYGVPYYIQTEEANRGNIYRISKVNTAFVQFLSDNGVHEVELEKYVQGKFYDVFVAPNILIEIDPSYTHSAQGNHWNAQGLPQDYHHSKTELATLNKYRCIHVFDWDDWDKVIEIIQPCTTLFARKCDVRQVDKKTADRFTALNHISGRCNGQRLNYGLYYDNELVQIMTFGKPRYNAKYDLELLRLCSKSGTRVAGGASKLFTHFVRNNPTASVISYCDLSKFTGSVYEKLGMHLVNVTAPSKVWSKGTQKITSNLLQSRGYDQLFGTHYGKGTNNEQLMLDNGWLPVYDCGQAVYSYRR